MEFPFPKSWLTISRDGLPAFATPRVALADVASRRVVFVYDLRAAWVNFRELVGDQEEFKTWEIRAIHGIKTGAFTRAVRDGLIPHARGEYPGWTFDSTGAFLAGVQGALQRQGVPHKWRLAVTRFLLEALRPVEVVAT